MVKQRRREGREEKGRRKEMEGEGGRKIALKKLDARMLALTQGHSGDENVMIHITA